MMDQKDAKTLVKKLTDVAYEAGMQHNSEIQWNSKNNVLYINEEIVRHLTNKSTKHKMTWHWICGHCREHHKDMDEYSAFCRFCGTDRGE